MVQFFIVDLIVAYLFMKIGGGVIKKFAMEARIEQIVLNIVVIHEIDLVYNIDGVVDKVDICIEMVLSKLDTTAVRWAVKVKFEIPCLEIVKFVV